MGVLTLAGVEAAGTATTGAATTGVATTAGAWWATALVGVLAAFLTLLVTVFLTAILD